MSEAAIAGAAKIDDAVQAKLARQKRAQRVTNERYFRVHPELRMMMSAFVSSLIKDKPVDVHMHAESFFTNPGLAHSLGLEGWSRPATPDPAAAEFIYVDGVAVAASPGGGGAGGAGGVAADPRIPAGGSVGAGGIILDATGQPALDATGQPMKAVAVSPIGGGGVHSRPQVSPEYDDDELNPELAGTTGEDTVDLEQLLISLFQEADKDGSGSLDRTEFAALMATASLGLSESEIKLLLAESDENADGSVSYAEFVPLAVEVVQTMRLKQRYEEYEEDVTAELRDAALAIISKSADEVAAIVLAAGEKSSGVLSKAMVKAMLRNPAMALSKQQITSAVAAVPFGPDGSVAAAELAPRMHEVLVGAVVRALQMQNIGAVGEEIAGVLRHYDKEGSGFLDPRVAKNGLMQAFPFLTRLQGNALLSDPAAPYDADGKLAYMEYLPKLEAMIKAMGDPSAIRERAELAARAEIQPVALMSGVDREHFDRQLGALFKEADADGSGALDPSEFRSCMAKADLGLSDGDIFELLEMFDADGDGHIGIDEFMALAYDVLATMSRERAIMKTLYE